MEGALAVKPSTRAVLPARSTSAASMQSPPARAEATRVHHLVAGVRPARRAAEVEVLPEELGQAKAQGEGGGKDQPGIGHQAVVVEGDKVATQDGLRQSQPSPSADDGSDPSDGGLG